MAHLLVVDDSRLTRRIVVGALKSAGHTCVEASDGCEGLEVFQQGGFDCVMSDLLMPNMDGFEMTAAIREQDPSIPIIVASADIQESSRQRCEEIGVTRMLNKPMKGPQITEAVDEVLAPATAPVEA
ncbi:MAG: response regulator [Planctomycetota bacterium]